MFECLFVLNPNLLQMVCSIAETETETDNSETETEAESETGKLWRPNAVYTALSNRIKYHAAYKRSSATSSTSISSSQQPAAQVTKGAFCDRA